jgi:UPF0755 protein
MLMRKTAALLLAAFLLFAAGCSKPAGAASSGASVSSAPAQSAAASAESGGAGGTQASETVSPAGGAGTKSSAQESPGSAAASAVSRAASSAEEKASTVKVTIPEGFTIAQIARRLEANGVCSAADFISMAQTYDFSYYPLVAAIPAGGHRAYRLEGYLYPDTYEMYVDMKPQDAVGKFLRNAEASIGGAYAYSGMTTDEVVTLASVIQGEAADSESMKMVSSVFHNRLKAGMQLDADATIDYCTQTLLSPNGPFADEYKYYYNTYRCSALPAGPICNPGSDALRAAVNPADTDYYYFFTAPDGKYYYQKTLEEHEAALKQYGLA